MDFFKVDAFLSSLPLMGKGMLGIFIVTAIIIIATAILNASDSIGSKKEK